MIHLVDESEDGKVAQSAGFKQLARLRLNALTAIEHHHRAVDGGQGAIGIFAEVLVTRRVQQIEEATAILELQYGGGDADATGLLNRHPIGGRVATIALGTHGAGRVHRASIEQELFGQGGLAGIRMRDDGEGPPASDLRRESGVGGVVRNRGIRDGLGRQGYSNKLSGRGD